MGSTGSRPIGEQRRAAGCISTAALCCPDPAQPHPALPTEGAGVSALPVLSYGAPDRYWPPMLPAPPRPPQVSTPVPPQYIHGLRVQCGQPAVANCDGAAPGPAAAAPSPAPLFTVSSWSGWLGASNGPAKYGALCPCGTFVSVSARPPRHPAVMLQVVGVGAQRCRGGRRFCSGTALAPSIPPRHASMAPAWRPLGPTPPCSCGACGLTPASPAALRGRAGR